MKKVKEFIKKYIPKTAIAAFIIAFISAIALIVSIFSESVANFLNSTISTAFRIFMSLFTVLLPFSVFEILMCLIPVAVILLALFMWFKIRSKISAVRFLFITLAFPSFIFSGYVFSLGIPYHITPIEERMQISAVEVTAENLKETSSILRDEIAILADELSLGTESASSMNMSMAELSKKISEAYGDFSDEYGFPFNFYTRAKPMIFDEVMSSAHLLGIYTFFTGESNINDGYPDYTIPFTVAHEFAHQRGIIREDEANFLAFAVCIRSDDPYIRYSGYLNMYEYTISALYKTDEEVFWEVHTHLSASAFADIDAAYKHSEKYIDSDFGEAVGNVNDAYLQMNGTEGRISYSLSVRLAVAYFNQKS